MGVSVREATAEDYALFARLHPALGVPDPLPTAALFQARMLPDVLIACDDGEPIGYAHWRLYGATAHVVHLVVAEDFQRRGAGSALLQALRRRAIAAACTRWYLNVKTDNLAAIRLYERSGLVIEQRGCMLLCEWAALLELGGSSEAEPFEASVEDVNRFAQQHGLDPERLARIRERPAVIFVALRDRAGICAIGACDPGFPSIYPIAVARPEHAAALFRVLGAHARSAQVNLVIEGNAALAVAARATGAQVRFETYRMGAALP